MHEICFSASSFVACLFGLSSLGFTCGLSLALINDAGTTQHVDPPRTSGCDPHSLSNEAFNPVIVDKYTVGCSFTVE